MSFPIPLKILLVFLTVQGSGFDPGLVIEVEKLSLSCGDEYNYYGELQTTSQEIVAQEQLAEEVAHEETMVQQPPNANCSLGAGLNILLLGATGVGKSSLGNLLLGVNKGLCRKRGCLTCKPGWCKSGQCLKEEAGKCVTCKPGQCQKGKKACAEFGCLHRQNYRRGALMEPGEELPFQPGGGIDSVTLEMKAFSGPFLGTGPCVTLIDTPGAGDSKGKDYQHAIEMVKMLEGTIKTINLFVIMLKGTDRRFDSHMLTVLRLYEEIFGKEMWRSLLVEISYWKHSEEDTCARLTDYQPPLDEDTLTSDINQKVM